MIEHPFLVGGTDRFDTVLIEETGGAVLSKTGAEGVHSLAVPELGVGITIKVEDGAQRALFPPLLRILQNLKVLPTTLPSRLAEYLHKPLKNSRNEHVGQVMLAADFA